MNKYTLFFTWQSDRMDVKRMIDQKLRDIKAELEKIDICLILDQDTRGRLGTENIDQTVLAKIDACDIFVADITPVASIGPRKTGGHVKLLPNANVMYEYGYAKGIGKMNRCILLANLAEGENKEDLPFDINHDTITEFRTAANLGGLKAWILNIIENVDKERVAAPADLDASIHFSGLDDETTIYPQYVGYYYVPKSHWQESVTNNNNTVTQAMPNSLLSTTKLLQTTIENLTAPVANVQIVRPINKTTYLDRCPVSFVISNDLNTPIENCKSYIRCKNPEVHFHDDNVKHALTFKALAAGSVSVEKDEVFRHRPLINPHETLSVGDVFISVPHNLTEVILDWHISSAQGNSYGQLVVKVVPSIDYETIENNNLAGETRVEGKIITE